MLQKFKFTKIFPSLVLSSLLFFIFSSTVHAAITANPSRVNCGNQPIQFDVTGLNPNDTYDITFQIPPSPPYSGLTLLSDITGVNQLSFTETFDINSGCTTHTFPVQEAYYTFDLMNRNDPLPAASTSIEFVDGPLYHCGLVPNYPFYPYYPTTINLSGAESGASYTIQTTPSGCTHVPIVYPDVNGSATINITCNVIPPPFRLYCHCYRAGHHP